MSDYNTMLDAYEREQERRYSNRPNCDCCGCRIDTEYALFVNDEWFCNDCVSRYLRKAVDDYAEN